MTGSQPIELLSDVKESSDEYENAVFGTYTFEPEFFESKILPILQKRDAENILVLVDTSEYETKFSEVKSAGKEYYLDHCMCGKIFHPKFTFLTWQKGGKLIISSANLNENEWLTAGEILVNAEYDSAHPNPDAASAFWEMKQFLQDLVSFRVLRSSKHCSKLMEMLTQTKWLNEIDKPPLSGKIRIVHNMRKPILDQVLQVIGEQEILQVDIMSPFFEAIGSILKSFAGLGCRRFRIFLQPEKVVGFSQQEIVEARKDGFDIEIVASHFKDHEGRFIHAKVFVIRTDERAYCLIGSSNATRAGILETCKAGNLELCVVRMEDKSDYFDYILSPDVFNLRTTTVNLVPFRAVPNTQPLPATDILLTDARLEEKNLLVEFEPCTSIKVDDIKIFLRHNEEEPLIVDGHLVNQNTVKAELGNAAFSFCSEPTYITLEICSDNKTLKSSRRWISTQSLELAPRKRDLQRVKESDGRYGLISLLNQLDKAADSSEWLLYLIQWINFEDLAEDLDWVRRRVRTRTPDSNDETDPQLLEQPKIDAMSVLRKILKRHDKRFQKGLSNLEASENLPKAFENVFNLFMFLSKITLWFVLTYKTNIEELSVIRYHMEQLCALISKLREADPELVEPLVKRLAILEHMLILGFIIDQLQQRQGYTSKYPTVVKVFNDTYAEITKLGDRLGIFVLPEQPTSRFKDISKEYEEFKSIDLDLDRLARFLLHIRKWQ